MPRNLYTLLGFSHGEIRFHYLDFFVWFLREIYQYKYLLSNSKNNDANVEEIEEVRADATWTTKE